MHRRTFVAGLFAVIGGGKLGWDYLNPDLPAPSRDDIEVVDRHLDVETPPDTEDVGTGLAYIELENHADFPVKAKVTLELLKEGQPYEYGYTHEQPSAKIPPGDTAVLADSWTLDEFPDSIEATGLRVADISLSNANQPL